MFESWRLPNIVSPNLFDEANIVSPNLFDKANIVSPNLFDKANNFIINLSDAFLIEKMPEKIFIFQISTISQLIAGLFNVHEYQIPTKYI